MNALQKIAPDTLRIERVLDAPVDTVWRWLVDPQLRSQWFAGGTAADREGGEFELVFDHDNLSDEDVPYPQQYAKWKGAVSRERVVRADAPHLLTYTWDGGKEGQVTFELFPQGKQTRLVLTHTGISGPPAMSSFGGGWLSHIAVLEARLAGRGVPDFWKVHLDAIGTVAKEIGARA